MSDENSWFTNVSLLNRILPFVTCRLGEIVLLRSINTYWLESLETHCSEMWAKAVPDPALWDLHKSSGVTSASLKRELPLNDLERAAIDHNTRVFFRIFTQRKWSPIGLIVGKPKFVETFFREREHSSQVADCSMQAMPQNSPSLSFASSPDGHPPTTRNEIKGRLMMNRIPVSAQRMTYLLELLLVRGAVTLEKVDTLLRALGGRRDCENGALAFALQQDISHSIVLLLRTYDSVRAQFGNLKASQSHAAFPSLYKNLASGPASTLEAVLDTGVADDPVLARQMLVHSVSCGTDGAKVRIILERAREVLKYLRKMQRDAEDGDGLETTIQSWESLVNMKPPTTSLSSSRSRRGAAAASAEAAASPFDSLIEMAAASSKGASVAIALLDFGAFISERALTEAVLNGNDDLVRAMLFSLSSDQEEQVRQLLLRNSGAVAQKLCLAAAERKSENITFFFEEKLKEIKK